MSTERDLLTTRINLRAIFPVMKVILSDDPKMQKRFKDVTATVQFKGIYNGEEIGACLVFKNGNLEIEQGISNNPTLTFSFRSIEKMNAMLAGKPAIPKIKGWLNIGLLIKIFSLLLSLTIMMPNNRPKTPEKKRLKIKMVIYMVTTALSQYNKGGDPEMVAWTKKQPDRIYQMSVDSEEDIAAYLRIKAGKSKAGRGFYKRRRPFVHMKFANIDGALAVILKDVEFVEGLEKGYVSIEGSPEYAANMNDFMQRIQAMVS